MAGSWVTWRRPWDTRWRQHPAPRHPAKRMLGGPRTGVCYRVCARACECIRVRAGGHGVRVGTACECAGRECVCPSACCCIVPVPVPRLPMASPVAPKWRIPHLPNKASPIASFNTSGSLHWAVLVNHLVRHNNQTCTACHRGSSRRPACARRALGHAHDPARGKLAGLAVFDRAHGAAIATCHGLSVPTGRERLVKFQFAIPGLSWGG